MQAGTYSVAPEYLPVCKPTAKVDIVNLNPIKPARKKKSGKQPAATLKDLPPGTSRKFTGELLPSYFRLIGTISEVWDTATPETVEELQMVWDSIFPHTPNDITSQSKTFKLVRIYLHFSLTF